MSNVLYIQTVLLKEMNHALKHKDLAEIKDYFVESLCFKRISIKEKNVCVRSILVINDKVRIYNKKPELLKLY